MVQIQKNAYYNRFSTFCYGCFWGIFDSFSDARNNAPKTKSLSWNSKEQAEWERNQFKNNFSQIESFDYPALHWISKIYQENPKALQVFDFGGSMGQHYYSYTKALPDLSIKKWIVCDVPMITDSGIEFKIKSKTTVIDFSNSITQDFKADIFLASGSLQYVDEKNPTFFLKEFSNKPRYIIINRIPLVTGNSEQIITLQNLYNAFAPMYTYHFNNFFSEFKNNGYVILDTWKDFSSNCKIPNEPKVNIPYYHGVCMKLSE